MRTENGLDFLPELKVGAWYWVKPTTDPDYPEGEEWQAGVQIARFAGNGRWWCCGISEASDWPMVWVGEEVPVPNGACSS